MRTYFSEIKKEIESLKNSHNIFVVEGKKDKKALINIGFRGADILTINRTGTSLYVVIDDLINSIGKNKVCVLTDLDRKGRMLYRKIREKFDESGVRTDGRLRHLLIKENVSHIEGLDTFLENGENNKKGNKNFRH